MSVSDQISACTRCARDFAATRSAHLPRPVVWFRRGAPILVAGQAPGMRVHLSGKPFDDPSGDRLRQWMGIDKEVFYDRNRLSIVPMAFCFPGYDDRKSDLPPPKRCAETWRSPVMKELGDVPLLLLVGGYAQKWHLGTKSGVTETVRQWRDVAPAIFPLPHPSWRNTAWLKANPWFEQDLLPELRRRVQEVLRD